MDALADGVIGYQQALMLIGAFFLFALAAVLAGNDLRWRRRAERVAGIIAGVRVRNNFFYPVYRYTLASGTTHESTADVGAATPRGLETGRMVPLMVFPGDPETARRSDSLLHFTAAAVAAAPAAGLAYVALVRYPVTRATWFMLTAFALYALITLQRAARRKDRPAADWSAAMRRRHAAEMQGIPVRRIEEFLSSDEGKRFAVAPAKTRVPAAGLLLAGFLLLCGGLYMGNQYNNLLINGLAAEGRIEDIIRDGREARPVVSFTDAAGRAQRFTGPPRDGGDAAGDAVRVLYLPEDPAATAMIDRGARGMLGALLMLGFGTLFTFLGLRAQRAGRG